MAEVITFRPTPETQDILAGVKAEGGNISKFINKQILSGQGGAERGFSQLFSFFPEENGDYFNPDSTGVSTRESVAMYTVPIGALSARRYKEFIGVLKSEGMDYFYFRIDDDHTVGIVAVNRNEASIELAKYYNYDRKTKEYDRTSIPLPQVRYHLASHTVVIITCESV